LRTAERGSLFLDWLASGHHAGMGYLARRTEVRLDPRRVFEGARSALCVALRYGPQAGDPGSENDLWRGVARYARGQDYHDIMSGMLAALSSRIEATYAGSMTRWYVDTGPVLERELAAAAGLGAVGKNTCLLDPESGSLFFLGEIFTTLDLEPDTPVADLCGSCSKCLEACPTGALRAPFVLDSNRCISYWTIEHRGPIPAAYREALDGWVFGCDVCQEVCPANDDAPGASHPALSRDARRSTLDLAGLVSLGVDEYRTLFRGSAMKRAKLEGLKRNAMIAMGNSRDSEYVAPLEEQLAADQESLRSVAAWALGRIGGEGAVRVLRRARTREAADTVLTEIESALQEALDGS
jgi:epoxyqueuosine reductase